MKEKTPLVSVLMAVYNGEKYLREAIESILNQTYTNFEFLIINDGSTDTTEEIILSYRDERIRYIKNEHNLKLIASLNKGLDLANGKYIARMDADDVSIPERLEKQVEFMERNLNHILVASCVSFIPNEKIYGTQSLSSNEIRLKLLSNNCIYHTSVMLRKSMLDGHYYSKDYLHIEDYEFWTRLIGIGKFFILDLKLVKYRVHSESICQKNEEFQYKQVKLVRRNLIKNFIPNIANEEFEYYNKFLNEMTNDFFKNLNGNFEYNGEAILKLDKLICSIESHKSSQMGISSIDLINYLRGLMFNNSIEAKRMPKKYFFNYIFSKSFSLKQFSKKIILIWLIH